MDNKEEVSEDEDSLEDEEDQRKVHCIIIMDGNSTRRTGLDKDQVMAGSQTMKVRLDKGITRVMSEEIQ